MVRSKNIGKLAYHDFTTGDDLIKIIYNKTKADQDGEKIRDNHDPFNPLIFFILALGVWSILEARKVGGSTTLFAVDNTGVDAPTNKYPSALS